MNENKEKILALFFRFYSYSRKALLLVPIGCTNAASSAATSIGIEKLSSLVVSTGRVLSRRRDRRSFLLEEEEEEDEKEEEEEGCRRMAPVFDSREPRSSSGTTTTTALSTGLHGVN